MESDRDGNGLSIPPETREWYVGAVCHSNAVTAHSLVHWKYALNEWVEDALQTRGILSGPSTTKQESLMRKRQWKDADSIMRKWVDDGTLSSLYKDFKDLLETARNRGTTGGMPKT